MIPSCRPEAFFEHPLKRHEFVCENKLSLTIMASYCMQCIEIRNEIRVEIYDVCLIILESWHPYLYSFKKLKFCVKFVP